MGSLLMVMTLWGCATAPRQMAAQTLDARAQSFGSRAAVATGMARYVTHLSAGNREVALAWLEEAWRRRGALLDDRALLDIVASVPGDDLPAVLGRARDVQRVHGAPDSVVRTNLEHIKRLAATVRGAREPGDPGRDPTGWN